MIFTFWEGRMSEYIKLCLKTWKFDFVILNYENLKQYTDFDIETARNMYTLPQISDIVRAHVLRDQGGHWIDADTMFRDVSGLPEENVIGDTEKRGCHFGILHAPEKNMDMFVKCCEYQESLIGKPSSGWSMFCNDFADPYIKEHQEITIHDARDFLPEYKMIPYGAVWDRYKGFYFDQSFHLKDVPDVKMFVLHNSWTPDWYKDLETPLYWNCTLSNILREVLA